jgi:hypothetical protein
LGRILGYLTYTVDQSKIFNGKKLGEAALAIMWLRSTTRKVIEDAKLLYGCKE